jgi:dCMP deaminase
MEAKRKDRISRVELYLHIAQLMALRGTCQRLQVGCVITSEDNRIIGTGYNGPLPSNSHCEKCDLTKACNEAVHAEQNAITHAAKMGIPLNNAKLYLTHNPCTTCAKLIVQAGIKEVYYANMYRDISGIEILIANNIKTTHYLIYELPQLQNT